MTLQADRLARWPVQVRRHSYTERDSILYALGIGCGMDPCDESDLQFVYEEGLRAFPAMAHVIGYPGSWLQKTDVGLDYQRMLHGEQTMKLLAPLPPQGDVIGRTRVEGVYDKGPGRDALVLLTRELVLAETGALLGTVDSTLLVRGGGGFGGSAPPASVLSPVPDTPPDVVLDLPTSLQAALIYRLSGDVNPLHAVPAVALAAGFPRPILHGLSTLGVATRAVVKACSPKDPGALLGFGARFSAPVFPGETIRTEVWVGEQKGSFRCRVLERDAVVLTNGYYHR